jgi:hypothetical protein
MHKKARKDMESELTLNMFYLAQAYGLAGDAHLSSYYCHLVYRTSINQ